MGTVVTALLVDEAAGTVAIGHVGDSRAYRIRDGSLEQLTPDHSLVGELVRAGRLSTEEAEQHPHRSVITRAVGTEPVVEVHTETLATLPGDLYLICSDGLTDLVRDERDPGADRRRRGRPGAGGPVTRRRRQQRGRDRQHHRRPLRDPRRRPRPTVRSRPRRRARRRHGGARRRAESAGPGRRGAAPCPFSATGRAPEAAGSRCWRSC